MADEIASIPSSEYYAVIFTSKQGQDHSGYQEMASAMLELAKEQQGYLGSETARDANGFAITVSYWQNDAAIQAWKENTQHLAAQNEGIKRWYQDYAIRVAKVERSYQGPVGRPKL